MPSIPAGAKTCAAAAWLIYAQTVLLRGELDAQQSPAPASRLSVPAFEPALPVPAVRAARDPFVLPDAVAVHEPAIIEPTGDAAAGLPVLPPNAGAMGVVFPGVTASGAPRSPSSAIDVLGVTTGGTPHALISTGTVTAIYQTGQRIGDRTIESISMDGVLLRGGIRLRVRSGPL